MDTLPPRLDFLTRFVYTFSESDLHRSQVKDFFYSAAESPAIPMTQITVRLTAPRDRSYAVEIRPGLFASLPELLTRDARGGRIFIVTDTTVARLYATRIHRLLRKNNHDCLLLVVPPGEQSKSERTAYRLQSRLLRGGIRRDSLVVAIGGGVVGDLAGYVAATILRGVRFVQVPTTLLAQVDSSVGGKVGIDHPAGKNLIGAFHQPESVYCDPLVLRTLPTREFRNGLAEVIKIAAALDPDLFTTIEENAAKLSRTSTRILTQVIATSVGLKAAIVERDEREAGLRATLNLGHTIAHALEASAGYALRHGEAVAIGLAAEARIAREMSLLDGNDCERLVSTLKRAGLPTELPKNLHKRKFIEALALDKKGDAGGSKFVLLRSIGKCALGVSVPAEILSKTAGLGSILKRSLSR
jgi:3-dehydroquinate synthase